jgi:hypothetical protein
MSSQDHITEAEIHDEGVSKLLRRLLGDVREALAIDCGDVGCLNLIIRPTAITLADFMQLQQATIWRSPDVCVYLSRGKLQAMREGAGAVRFIPDWILSFYAGVWAAAIKFGWATGPAPEPPPAHIVLEAAIEFALRAIESWDLYLTEGDARAKLAAPVTRDTIGMLPATILNTIVQRVLEKLAPMQSGFVCSWCDQPRDGQANYKDKLKHGDICDDCAAAELERESAMVPCGKCTAAMIDARQPRHRDEDGRPCCADCSNVKLVSIRRNHD